MIEIGSIVCIINSPTRYNYKIGIVVKIVEEQFNFPSVRFPYLVQFTNDREVFSREELVLL